MASEKITAMIDEIKALSVLELKELVDEICETFGVSAVAAAAPAAGGAAEAVAEKTEFDVVMTSFGAEKIKVIKEIRGITGLGLAEAKAMVEKVPVAVKEHSKNSVHPNGVFLFSGYLIRRVSMIASISGFERSFTRSSSLSSPMSTTVVST